MSERHWPRPALATTALALLGATAAAAAETAGVAATTGHKAITADQLKGALLTKVGGANPATAPESGNYGALPDVQTSKQTMHGVKVGPDATEASVRKLATQAYRYAAQTLA